MADLAPVFPSMNPSTQFGSCRGSAATRRLAGILVQCVSFAPLLACGGDAPSNPSAEEGSDPSRAAAVHSSGVGHGVLLVVVDGLRADHLSSWGYDRETTPNLDRLAQEGVRFENTFGAAPAILPANAALLTGCDPELGWSEENLTRGEEGELEQERRWQPPVGLPRLAVEFLAQGYSTAAFVDHPWVSPAFGLRRGFQDYTISDTARVPGPTGSGIESLAPHVRSWLAQLDGDEPWFAYVHLHDLERSWRSMGAEWEGFFEPRPGLERIPPAANSAPAFFGVPRPRWRARRSLGAYEARYDGAIRRMDHHVGRLLDSLRHIGRRDRTTICVVGSHGIEFGEEGLYLVGGALAAPDLHVPWILRPAVGTAEFASGTVSHIASTVDVAPTLLAHAGLSVPRAMQGLSQVPALRQHDLGIRSSAYASGGLFPGFVVFGEEYAYRKMRPGDASDVGLVRSWFGDLEHHWGEEFEHCFDWRSPDGADLEVDSTPECAAQRAEAKQYYERLDALRRVLSKPGGVELLEARDWSAGADPGEDS